jgi:hypothetical protein
MDRGAHQLGPEGAALGDEQTQLLGIEPLEARPQGDIRISGLLGLEPHEMLDDVGDRP